MNDSAWTTLRFATVARKQQVTNVTMTSLARIANAVVMDPRDAFTKLRYGVRVLIRAARENRESITDSHSSNI